MCDEIDAVSARMWAWDAERGDFVPLLIDECLGERSSNSRLPITHDLQTAKKHARRGVEVAYYEVLRIRREMPGPIARDFGVLCTRVGAARRTLEDLLAHLQPNANSAADLALPILTAQAGLSDGTARDQHKQAEADALKLWGALEVIRRLEEMAPRKEARVRMGRQNDGKPDQRIFIATLAETWIFLTGRTPGKNPDPDKNPFVRFARSAWSDLFGSDDTPDFIGALRALPVWSDYKISELKSQGPRWT